jgi:hypothetical protein
MVMGGHVSAQQQTDSSAALHSARPVDSTANLPSDSGSHTTLPSGAVTGAGLPEGSGKQPDVGKPGGLEPRARALARTQARAEKALEDEGASRSIAPGERFERGADRERYELGG